MSAFLVSTQTLNRITVGLRSGALCPTGQGTPPDPKHVAPSLAGGLRAPIGNLLWALNMRALRARYEDRADIWQPEVDAGYVPQPLPVPLRLVQLAKSLQCLLYQCSEGEVEDEPLYQEVRAYLERVLSKIASELPEYEQAEWD